MYLARVTGRVVATLRSPGLEGVPLQWIQPIDETGAEAGAPLVACAAISAGPGDVVHFVDGREAALALPRSFVPVDAAIVGFVEEAEAGPHRLRQGPSTQGPSTQGLSTQGLSTQGPSTQGPAVEGT